MQLIHLTFVGGLNFHVGNRVLTYFQAPGDVLVALEDTQSVISSGLVEHGR